jgi:hypothetical protein
MHRLFQKGKNMEKEGCFFIIYYKRRSNENYAINTDAIFKM